MMVRMRWLEVSTQVYSLRLPLALPSTTQPCSSSVASFIPSLPHCCCQINRSTQEAERAGTPGTSCHLGESTGLGNGETTWSRPADPDEGCLHGSTTPVLSRRTGQKVLAELLIAYPPEASPSLNPGAVCRARKFFCMIAIVTRRIYKLHSWSTFCRLPFQNSQTDSGVSLSGALCGLHISSWLPVFRLLPSPLPGGSQAQD